MAMASFWDSVATTLDLPLLGWPTTAKTGGWVTRVLFRLDKGCPVGLAVTQPTRTRSAAAQRSATRAAPDGLMAPGWHRLPAAESSPQYSRARASGLAPEGRARRRLA